MWFSPDVLRIATLIADSLLPPAPESVIARAVTEEMLEALSAPATHREEPWIHALLPYHNPNVRALLKAIKYRGEKAPLPALGRVASQEILGILEDKILLEGWRSVLMAPVPGSPKRRRERGYNQADRIARAILPFLATSVEYAPDILERRDRPSQVDVPKEARHRNVTGAFFVPRPEKVSGRHILLVDDIVESGATLSDARRALLDSGATDVIAIAMAH